MDEQRAGKQLHRYRSRIAALTKVLKGARIFIDEQAVAGNKLAEQMRNRIDAVLSRAEGGIAGG